ncbi:LysM peptidoglycan-binding domain-containing protein [Endothiovibrio diazotrophicus]
MKLSQLLRYFAVVLLALGVAAGCASQQQAAEDPKAVAAQAIADAKAAYKEAVALGAAWRDTGELIKKAEKAFDEGDYATATKLANQAREQSETAINQWYLEQAKAMVAKAKGYTLTPEQSALLADAEAAIKANEGKRAYELAKQLMAALAAAEMRYTVATGDSLWKISGKSAVYGNPYQWPLIYKKNASQIKDADLIYPKQVLGIDKNPSSADVSAAVKHAKTRGAWAVGPVEASDKAYLGMGR